MFIKKFKIESILSIISIAILITMVSCDMKKKSSEDDASMQSDKIETTNVEESSKEKKLENEEESAIYTITDVDIQPLFAEECATMENPIECSNEKMLQFVKDNAIFPKAAANRFQDGFEQVIVIIEKDGSLSNMKYVASSKTKECDGCQKAAVDVVGMMKNWKPAMKDGKPVAVQMTIPVRFES